jgi:cell division protein FtsQ
LSPSLGWGYARASNVTASGEKQRLGAATRRGAPVGAVALATNPNPMTTVSRPGRARAAVLHFPGGLPRGAAARMLPSGRALVVGFALIAAAVGSYVVARETSVFAIRSLEVEGASPRVAAHVRGALAGLDGTSLLALTPSEVRARLDRLPDVASVTYDRSFPHTLRVSVVPAHSIAVLRRGADAWIVSSRGRIVRTAGPRAAPRLPRIWLPRSVDIEIGAQLADADATRAVAALAVARKEGFTARIAAVRAHDELTFVLGSRLEIRFGDPTALAAKVAVARAILPRAAGAAYLDVSAPDRAVVGTNSQVSG